MIETFVNVIYPLFPLFNTQSLGNHLELVGYIAVAFGIGGVAGLVAAGKLERLGTDGRLYMLSGFAGGPLMIAFGLVSDARVLLAVCAVWGAIYVLSEVSSVTALQRRIPGTLHGRAFASLRVVQKFAVLLSSAIVWTVGDLYRASAIFVACGATYCTLWIALSLTRGARALAFKAALKPRPSSPSAAIGLPNSARNAIDGLAMLRGGRAGRLYTSDYFAFDVR